MNDAIISGAGSLVGGRPLHRPISRVISPARCSPLASSLARSARSPLFAVEPLWESE